MTNINVGCGNLRMAGFVGLDGERNSQADVVCDLTWLPWPIKDGSVNQVRAWHILEHLPDYCLDAAMHEIHRVLVPGGLLYAKVPYMERGPYNPHHFHVFNAHTFDSWINSEGSWSAQDRNLFVRERQDVVSTTGFPLWHLEHRIPRLGAKLLEHDERGPWTRLPSTGGKELREWLRKPDEGE